MAHGRRPCPQLALMKPIMLMMRADDADDADDTDDAEEDADD
eukprot:CAMPEP_0183712548 /NCGR_PEP_ID=MMETSP0737-20130205/7653_1 /TAXON_ID=385413 /ORGANISM="Thalassiosira miniscula, Strain CCMP1093" /LENGTH=41 /DNA_ID= /DNA_START= /DNA_END= /DNA_ORIENTATION=